MTELLPNILMLFILKPFKFLNWVHTGRISTFNKNRIPESFFYGVSHYTDKQLEEFSIRGATCLYTS